MAMGLRKILQYSIVALVVVGMPFAVYEWLDTAVSLDHARQQQKTERERNTVLLQLVFATNRGAKRPEIARYLKQNFEKGHLIKEERDRIIMDDIVFRFDDTQSLTQVQLLNSAD